MKNERKRSKKIAFLDRDGVINKKARDHEYITSVKDFTFNDGIFPVLEKLKDDGFEFIIITNQRCVARSIITKEELATIHNYLVSELDERGIEVLDIFYCPHDIDCCECRKPKPGLLAQARKKYNIDLSNSILLSDSINEVEMGKKYGISHSYYVPTNKPELVLETLHKKIRIAFIKYGGLASGGTERMLQNIAANLDKNRFDVDYFYCDSSKYIGSKYKHPNTDANRYEYMVSKGINLVKFYVESRDLYTTKHDWIKTNFFEVFRESDYDLVQIATSGHKEFPFNRITKVPLLEIIALSAGVNNQFNISRTLHICDWSAKKWIKSGGDASRVNIISIPVEDIIQTGLDYKKILNLDDKFVFGFHQRDSDDIYSNIPLDSYKLIENDKTAFVLLGGSSLYKKQAELLDLKNIHFIEESSAPGVIDSFLSVLDVYSHGRKDGEVNSQAMAEAMKFGIPIISHTSLVNNGHIECIGASGTVVESTEEYSQEMSKLMTDRKYFEMRKMESRKRFLLNYEMRGQIKHIETIYESAVADPFPNKIKRLHSSLHWTQNVRIGLKYVYLRIKRSFNDRITKS